MIGGLLKVTVQDYPEHLACIIFLNGCNFKCPYCQNSQIAKCKVNEIPEEEVLEYLKKRKNILDGVVISGGEPTINKHLKDLIKEIKEIGLDVKLDTNGYQPNVIKELINENLVDYIAMDIKEILPKNSKVVGININPNRIKESIEIIKNSKVKHEFRTTLIKEIHTLDDIQEIVKMTGESLCYLQNFNESEYVENKNLHGFSHDELVDIYNKFKSNKNLRVRGI